MTLPWMRARTKDQERQRLAGFGLIGLHFLVATTACFVVMYSNEWMGGCYWEICDYTALLWITWTFVVLDGVVFLGAWAWTMIALDRGWRRMLIPAAGILLTVVGALVSLALVWLALHAEPFVPEDGRVVALSALPGR